jgi:hypothetical protein
MNRTRTGGPLHANPDIITSAGRLVTLNGVDPGLTLLEEIVLTILDQRQIAQRRLVIDTPGTRA